MKLLSIQPGSIYENGGAGRVLRRLFQGREKYITAIYVSSGKSSPKAGPIKEIKVNWHPLHRRWARWKFRSLLAYFRHTFGKTKAMNLFIDAVRRTDFEVMHIVNHGEFCATIHKFYPSILKHKQIWVSFHDHYSLCSTFEDAHLLWNEADRRLCISKELGDEYKHIFGDLPYEVITDGIYKTEHSKPAVNVGPERQIIIYFAGLLHIDYYPNFKALVNAMALLSNDGVSVKLILRGTQRLPFINDTNKNVIYKTGFVSDTEIKKELDEATVLYLPMKFNVPNFYLYSLSTKMIGYLSAGGGIFYHGPETGAAANLLKRWDAATICTTLNPEGVKNDFLNCLKEAEKKSTNAKKLAQTQFDMDKMVDAFWTKENTL